MSLDVKQNSNKSLPNGNINKKDNVIVNLINDFGGPLAIITATQSFLDFASKLSKNQTYQKIISGLKTTIPAAIVGYKFYDSIKTFYENNLNKNVSIAKNHRILKLMKYNSLEFQNQENRLQQDTIKLGAEITNWLMRSPAVNGFEIKGYYDENFNSLPSNFNGEKGTYYVLLRKDLIYYVLEFVTLGIVSNKLLLMSSSIWYCGNEVYEQLSLLKKLIIQNFVISLNTLDNIIIYGNTGIETRQKIKVDYEINQFDVYKLAEEIKSVINKKRKRGYIFAGVPGTGKSSILLKLEGLLTEFPILYISKSAINYSGDMNAAFDLIITLSPCIVIFEDLDCFGFSNKNTKLFNEFLQEIDNVYENFHSVIIATINNASEVHHSLINRPGRFDQVFMISPPQSLTEVFKVMDNKFNKTTGEHIYIENINKDLLQSIIDNKFTQADICEIIEKILINDKEFNNESLKYSISELMASKEAIKNCSFNKEVLIEYDDYYD